LASPEIHVDAPANYGVSISAATANAEPGHWHRLCGGTANWHTTGLPERTGFTARRYPNLTIGCAVKPESRTPHLPVTRFVIGDRQRRNLV